MSKPDETSAVGTDSPKPLPGRHLAPPGERSNRWLVGLGVLSVLLVAVLLVVRASGVGQEPRQAAVTASTVDVLGPSPPPPARPAAFGNLVSNWSFEQDLRGWSAVGPATVSRELQGRTSGSAAAVRVLGGVPQRAGLALLKAVPSAQEGSRYVASAWVRSTPPGLKVTLRLVTIGGSEASEAVTTTPPGDRWSRVTVTHTVAAAQSSLDLQIMAAGLRPGEALFVDEVELREGRTP
jgi:Carbohydrate binding domain